MKKTILLMIMLLSISVVYGATTTISGGISFTKGLNNTLGLNNTGGFTTDWITLDGFSAGNVKVYANGTFYSGTDDNTTEAEIIAFGFNKTDDLNKLYFNKGEINDFLTYQNSTIWTLANFTESYATVGSWNYTNATNFYIAQSPYNVDNFTSDYGNIGSLNCSSDGSCTDITYDSELAYIKNCSTDLSCSPITYDTELQNHSIIRVGNASWVWQNQRNNTNTSKEMQTAVNESLIYQFKVRWANIVDAFTLLSEFTNDLIFNTAQNKSINTSIDERVDQTFINNLFTDDLTDDKVNTTLEMQTAVNKTAIEHTFINVTGTISVNKTALYHNGSGLCIGSC
jgi:hypothetical protein